VSWEKATTGMFISCTKYKTWLSAEMTWRNSYTAPAELNFLELDRNHISQGKTAFVLWPELNLVYINNLAF